MVSYYNNKSDLIFDMSTNYSFTSNFSSFPIIDNFTLIQIKEVLDMFKEDNLVLQEPVHSIIISIYCVLVSTAGIEFSTSFIT